MIGTPSKEDMLFITNNKALEYIKGMESKKKVPLKHLYPNANPIALDLMEKMLAFNPNKRITVEEALDHEYFKSLRIKETEVKCDKSFTFEFEKMKLTEKNLQKCTTKHLDLLHSLASKYWPLALPHPTMTLFMFYYIRYVGRDSTIQALHQQPEAVKSAKASCIV